MYIYIYLYFYPLKEEIKCEYVKLEQKIIHIERIYHHICIECDPEEERQRTLHYVDDWRRRGASVKPCTRIKCAHLKCTSYSTARRRGFKCSWETANVFAYFESREGHCTKTRVLARSLNSLISRKRDREKHLRQFRRLFLAVKQRKYSLAFSNSSSFCSNCLMYLITEKSKF